MPLLAHGGLGHGLGWTYLALFVGMAILVWTARRRGEDEGQPRSEEGRHDGA